MDVSVGRILLPVNNSYKIVLKKCKFSILYIGKILPSVRKLSYTIQTKVYGQKYLGENLKSNYNITKRDTFK